jgi:hypothetical protein
MLSSFTIRVTNFISTHFLCRPTSEIYKYLDKSPTKLITYEEYVRFVDKKYLEEINDGRESLLMQLRPLDAHLVKSSKEEMNYGEEMEECKNMFYKRKAYILNCAFFFYSGSEMSIKITDFKVCLSELGLETYYSDACELLGPCTRVNFESFLHVCNIISIRSAFSSISLNTKNDNQTSERLYSSECAERILSILHLKENRIIEIYKEAFAAHDKNTGLVEFKDIPQIMRDLDINITPDLEKKISHLQKKMKSEKLDFKHFLSLTDLHSPFVDEASVDSDKNNPDPQFLHSEKRSQEQVFIEQLDVRPPTQEITVVMFYTVSRLTLFISILNIGN